MPDRIDVPLNPGFDHEFKSRDGIVGRDLSTRATRLQLAAKAQSGVRTGANKRDIKKRWISGRNGDLAISVGSDVPHALVHHDGAKPHIIRARNTRAVRYVNKAGEVVFAKVVNHPGTKENRFLTDNLHLAIK